MSIATTYWLSYQAQPEAEMIMYQMKAWVLWCKEKRRRDREGVEENRKRLQLRREELMRRHQREETEAAVKRKQEIAELYQELPDDFWSRKVVLDRN